MIGALGFLLRRADVPVAPAVVGLILGPLAEEQLRRALAISQGDPAVLVSSPLAVVLLVLAVAAVVLPILTRTSPRRRALRQRA